jgi:hypothetical protein
MARSPLIWFGRKSKLASDIIARMQQLPLSFS